MILVLGANLSSSNTLEILFIRLPFPDPLGPTNMRRVCMWIREKYPDK